VKKQRRHLELAQPPIIQILVRPLDAVSDPKPNRAVAVQNCCPARFTVVLSKHPARFFANSSGWAANRSKRIASGFPLQEVEGLQNHARAAFRRS